MSPFTIVLLRDSKRDLLLYFVESQPAPPGSAFARDWLTKLSAEAGGNAARFEKIANARFSGAGFGKHALRRSLTLECHHETLANPAATQFLCSEQAAAEVYTALRSGTFCDYGSDAAMSWCPARCLMRNRSIQTLSLSHRFKGFQKLRARVDELLAAHTHADSAADALRDVFRSRCGLGVVAASDWLPAEWGESTQHRAAVNS